MSDLVHELRDALSYMIDVHHGDITLEAEDRAHFERAAYFKAIAAVRRAEVELHQARPKNPLETLREQQQAAALVDVKDDLREARQAAGDRLVKGVGVLLRLEDFDEDDRTKRAGAFRAIALRFTSLAQQVAMPLPATDACICRHCQKILLPSPGRGYNCCSRFWGHHAASNFSPLPAGFWEKFRPGDRYTKRLAPTLDGQGRPELGELA